MVSPCCFGIFGEHFIELVGEAVESAHQVDEVGNVMRGGEAVLPGICFGVIEIDFEGVEGLMPGTVVFACEKAGFRVEEVSVIQG